MARSAILGEQLRRVLVFGAVTLAVALVLNLYARVAFHPLQLLWGFFGLLIGAVEQFFFTGRIARAPVWGQLLLRVAIIVLLAMLLVSLILLLGVVPRAFHDAGITTVAQLWTTRTGIMVNALIVSSAVMLFMEMERMVGPAMFRRFLTGRYVHPRREERVVMFMDLVGSTALTERLGDQQYFKMLNELFDAMTGPVLASGAEILKYIGDEVVFTWRASGTEPGPRCLHLLFDVQQAIDRKAAHYQSHYGTVPRFRAGIHRGEVIVAQIGVIKRSIDLSGDAMNTCARLAGAAKDMDTYLLASEDLLSSLRPLPEVFKLGNARRIDLKGKAEPMGVVGVARV